MVAESELFVTKPRFEIFKDDEGQYRFRIVSLDDEIILQSESYDTRRACKKGIEAVKLYSLAPVVDTTRFW
jgi:uncharacterized protein YegP (UPF0339 family)